jgi:hypothetical protein
MDSVQKQVECLMRLNPDTELQFDDGSLPANSNMLSFFSSVLRGAVQAPSAGGSSNSSSTIVIPMKGLTKVQWLEVAPFWHPVGPAAVVKTWAEAELLLRVGSRFDLRPALDKASEFLTANVDKLTVTSSNPTGSSTAGKSLWKWLQLADELRLSGSLPTLVKRAVDVDWDGCSKIENIQGLSAATLQQLVMTLVAFTEMGKNITTQMPCRHCNGYTLQKQFSRCTVCRNYLGG